MARANLIKAKQRSKGYYDRRLNIVNFKLGDSVFVSKGKKSNKMEDHYTGSHEVLAILLRGSIKVSSCGKTKSTIVAPDRVRRSHIPANNA